MSHSSVTGTEEHEPLAKALEPGRLSDRGGLGPVLWLKIPPTNVRLGLIAPCRPYARNFWPAPINRHQQTCPTNPVRATSPEIIRHKKKGARCAVSPRASEIIKRYGLDGWVSARLSNLRIDGVPRLAFTFQDGNEVHFEAGICKRLAIELNADRETDAARVIEEILKQV